MPITNQRLKAAVAALFKETAMKLTSLAGLVAVAAVIGLAAADVAAQYYVPLRYDLRYTSPTYIPSMNYGYAAPSRADPYAFGSVQYGNLDVTGNIRYGRSFQGRVPYNQTGSQLATSLPSLALSNFKRDSIGIGDIGMGIEYGAPQPYFPGSGSVTSVYTAETRFATPPPGARAPYDLPNLNSAMPALPPQPPGIYYVPPAPPPAAEPQAAVRPPGLYVPQSALEWVNALAEGRLPAPQTAAAENTGQRDMRIGTPARSESSSDLRIGVTTPAAPEAVQPGAAKEPKSGALTPEESFEATQSALYWVIRQAAAKPPEGAPTEKMPAAGTPAAPAAPTGTKTAEALPGAEEEPPAIPPPPEKYRAPGTYADYVEQAQAAMKESNYAKAEGLYDAAATQDANRPAAFFGRVYALMGDRQYMLASYVVDRAIQAHPTWCKEVPAIAAAYAKPGIYDRIVTDLKAELALRPGNAETCLLLGYVYFAAGQKDSATFYLNHVAQLRAERAGAERALLAALEPPAAK